MKKINLIINITNTLIIILFISYLFITINNINKNLKTDLKYIHETIMNNYKIQLKNSVDLIDSIISINNKYYNNISKNKKKIKIETLLREYIYEIAKKDKNSYIWINKILDFKGGQNFAIRVIHPNLKSSEGEYLSSNLKDIKGNTPYLTELDGINKKGNIYFKYFFKELTTNKITQKLTYSKLNKEFSYTIARGIPLNEIEIIINNRKNKLENKIQKQKQVHILLSIIIFILILSLSFFLKKTIKKYIKENELLKESFYKKERELEHNKTILLHNKEKIRFQEELNKSHKKFKKVFMTNQLLMVLIQKENTLIVEVNNSFTQHTGYKRDYLLGKKLSSFNFWNKKSDSEEFFNDLFNNKKIRNKLYDYVTSKNKIRSAKINAESINIDDEVFILFSLEDITETLNLQKELKEKELLLAQQSKMASMGEMLENIAHQWRQPLSVITTASTGLKLREELDQMNREVLISSLDTINDNAQYLSKTIDDFRNFFNVNIKKESFLLNSCFTYLLKLLNQKFISSNIQFICNNEDIELFGSKNELIQVIMNILNNSKDAFENKSINKIIEIKTKIKDNKILIIIRDSAEGIPKNIINKIFEPYFTTKHKTQGTGIGLYMSQKIVMKNFNGFISVKNVEFIHEEKKQKGAMFIIEIDKNQDN